MKNDDYQQAIDEFTEAIRLKPDEEFAFLNRGTAYYSLQQYDQAISDFTEFIRPKPDFDAAFFNRARTYYRLQQSEGNTGEQHMRRTLSRVSVSQRLDRVRGAACELLR